MTSPLRELRRRRLTVWLAILALCYQAVVPAYAMALIAAGPDEAIPICHGSGSATQVPDEFGIPGKSGDRGSIDCPFCPFCLGHVPSFAIPVGPTLTRSLVAAQRIVHEAGRETVASPKRYILHISRAPPASS